MSLFGLFDIAKTSLFASQTALAATSKNIANINTPGYSRQEVILEIANPVTVKGGLLGMGVSVKGIKRHYDGFIHAQLIGQHQNYGRSFTLNRSLSRIEQIFNETNNMGLSSSLMDFFNAWQDVSTNPEGSPQRMVLLQKAGDMAVTARRMESGILDTLRHANDEIDDIVNRVNSIAGEIAALNERIMQIETGYNTENAPDLRDSRDNLLSELSELVEFSYFEDSNGYVNITAGMRNLVYGEKTGSLTTRINEDGNRDLYLDGVNITSHISKGQLGGLIAFRDNIESETLHETRKLIASLTKEINTLHSSGYGLDGTTGNDFFNPLQLSTKDYSAGADITSAAITDLSALTLDEYNVTFDAANNYYVYNSQSGALVTSGSYTSGSTISFDGIDLVITGAVTASDGFFVSPLTDAVRNFGVAVTETGKIAASASNTTLPGDNTIALEIARLSDSSLYDLGNSSFMDYYKGIVSGAGTLSRAASDSLRFDDNLLAELQNRRESISGVSLDEEAVNLIRFQRAFEAGAKMIKVTDELIETILNL